MASTTSQFLGLTVFASATWFLLGHFFPEPFPNFHIGHVLLISTGISCILLSFWKLIIYPTFVDPLRHLPGPKGGIPLINHGFEHLKRPPSEKELEWITTIPNDGLLRHAGILGRYHHIPTTPKVLSELLVTRAYDFHKPDEGRGILRVVLGDGLVVSEGDVHRFQRKNLNPMFSFRHIKDLYPLMWSKSLELVDCIKAEMSANGNPESGYVVEVNGWASRATLDIIGVAALGRNLNALHDTEDELVQLYEWIFRMDFWKKLWFFVHFLFPKKLIDFVPWKTNRDIMAKSVDLRRVCAKLVSEKRSEMAKESHESVDTLAHLIRSNNFSDQDLVDQLLTILAAGHETTSSMFTWVLSILAQHPEHQTRLRRELQRALDPAALSDPAQVLQLNSVLEALPFLNAICSETARLYPTVPNTRRIAVRDTQLNGLKIPSGTDFIIPIWWLNRTPTLWGERATEFVPDRWIDGEGAAGRVNHHGGAESNFALLTFLHGARSCIGQGFAKAELRCLVAAWVLAFEFSMAREGEQLIPEGVVTVKPRGGLLLKVKPVKGMHPDDAVLHEPL